MPPIPTVLLRFSSLWSLKFYIRRSLLQLVGHWGWHFVLGGAVVMVGVVMMVSRVVRAFFYKGSYFWVLWRLEFLFMMQWSLLLSLVAIGCTIVEMSMKLWCGADGCTASDFPIYPTAPVGTLITHWQEISRKEKTYPRQTGAINSTFLFSLLIWLPMRN